MTSVYDIPYEDIKKFLLANNKNWHNENEAYQTAFDLLKDKKSKGHTISIVEWMIAHNLLINNVDIPHYTTYEIDNMSQNEIDKLAKLLTMKGNNRNNIKNILKYLHKLDEEFLLPEINEIILENLTRLELRDINDLNAYDVINLFKNYRDKRVIRKFISDNMQKILAYNFLNSDFDILTDNKKKLIERYDIEEDDKSINFSFYKRGVAKLDLVRLNMDILAHFVVKLIEMNEIELAQQAIYLTNQYEFPRGLPFIYYLTEKLIYRTDDSNVIRTLINIIGENMFIEQLRKNVKNYVNQNTNISKFLEKLVQLKDYDLLIKSLQVLIDEDYTGNKTIISTLLQKIKRAIPNDDLIIRYLNIIKSMSWSNSVKSGNRQMNAVNRDRFNKNIKEAEEFK